MIEIRLDGRLVLTTDQAVERSNRWKDTAVLRAWISRHHIEPAAALIGNIKLYYPEDLGIQEES